MPDWAVILMIAVVVVFVSLVFRALIRAGNRKS
jgi:hypothetical protein